MDVNGRRERVKLQIYNTTDGMEHFHQDIELLYVLEGSLDVIAGEETVHLKEEDIFVINANKHHILKGSENVLFLQLSILYQVVSDVLQSSDVIFWCNSTNDKSERYEELRKILKVLLKHYIETKGDTANFGHIALCYRVLDSLSMYFLVRTSDKEVMDDQDKFDERIRQINNYIRANYSQPISLKELADQLYLSNGYLSRFFKRNYGMSFAEYLTNVRLFHAVDDLLYTSMPITRIAYDNGFASVAVFNKVFKNAYGETPSVFRKKAKIQNDTTQQEEQDEALGKRLEQYLITESEEEEIQSVDVCSNCYSVLQEKVLPYYWGRMINVGSASDLLRSEIREHVILLKEALKFEYVRFWNLFSKEMLINLDGEGGYNFSRLDSILDFVLEQGLKPHIEIGQKPKVILFTVQKTEYEGTMDVTFPDEKNWQDVLSAMMQHLARRYGRAELDTWRIELWFNESQWGQEGAAETYFRLFEILYRTVKQYSEGLEVGGSGIRMDYKIESRQDFYHQWKEREIQPDFISILYFAYDRGEEQKDMYAKRSTDDSGLKHWLEREIQLLDEAGLGEIKRYLTEWNLTASSRNYINDSCFKGSYIIKNVLDLYGMVDDMGYFIASDRVSESYDSQDLVYGGTGLMTKDGILKPAGFAFEFLQRLYPYYIGKGSNYLITTDRHDSYGILCHNQRKLGYIYYLTKEDELEKESLWKYFEDRDSLELHLELDDLPNGKYQIKAYRINIQNGNLMNIWKLMDYEKELSRNDVKYFRRMCEPKLSIRKQEVTDGKLNLDVKMQYNEIAFIRVRKLA